MIRLLCKSLIELDVEHSRIYIWSTWSMGASKRGERTLRDFLLHRGRPECTSMRRQGLEEKPKTDQLRVEYCI